jgi:hypothetical protein
LYDNSNLVNAGSYIPTSNDQNELFVLLQEYVKKTDHRDIATDTITNSYLHELIDDLFSEMYICYSNGYIRRFRNLVENILSVGNFYNLPVPSVAGSETPRDEQNANSRVVIAIYSIFIAMIYEFRRLLLDSTARGELTTSVIRRTNTMINSIFQQTFILDSYLKNAANTSPTGTVTPFLSQNMIFIKPTYSSTGISDTVPKERLALVLQTYMFRTLLTIETWRLDNAMKIEDYFLVVLTNPNVNNATDYILQEIDNAITSYTDPTEHLFSMTFDLYPDVELDKFIRRTYLLEQSYALREGDVIKVSFRDNAYKLIDNLTTTTEVPKRRWTPILTAFYKVVREVSVIDGTRTVLQLLKGSDLIGITGTGNLITSLEMAELFAIEPGTSLTTLIAQWTLPSSRLFLCINWCSILRHSNIYNRTTIQIQYDLDSCA